MSFINSNDGLIVLVKNLNVSFDKAFFMLFVKLIDGESLMTLLEKKIYLKKCIFEIINLSVLV